MAHTFERKALYEEVWSSPLTKLGAKYGLSDNGVRKVCKILNIPLPKAGHWAKIAAGHQVRKTPLRKHGGPETFHSPGATVDRPPQRDYSRPEDDAWLQEHLAFESTPDASIIVETAPTHWHRLLRPLKKRVAAGKKLYEKQLREMLINERRRRI